MDGSSHESVTFGRFQLYPSARTLERDGVPLALGARALDILIVLVQHAGEVVKHKDLLSRVWRGLVVEPGSLRVHMAGLRKALGDEQGKPRIIANIKGQGYSFIAPFERVTNSPPTTLPEYPCGAARQRLVLPRSPPGMVGRDEALRVISADLIAERFVTIVGPGGMGKTTVALAVAHALFDEFGGAVCFVDVGSVTSPDLVAATIASTLGLTVQNDDVLPALLLCLKTLRVLLVLDNCEHVIDRVAVLAETIYLQAPGIHILATSREALRVEGEHAYWLPPLATPPLTPNLTASAALNYPAVRLFVERSASGGTPLTLNDANAKIVADICARLDGLALAIEFAAAKVGTYGLDGTAELLKKRLVLRWQGRRTAPPRHQTLLALIDWSFNALDEPDRRILSRLSVLVGPFTADAARIVGWDPPPGEATVFSTLDGFVAKSLLSVAESPHGTPAYRLLETTRAYALERLAESGDAGWVAERHARYVAGVLDDLLAEAPPAKVLAAHLGNVRAALEWCFDEQRPSLTDESGTEGDSPATLSVRLAAGSVRLFLDLSLLHECQRWSCAALSRLDTSSRGSAEELVLQQGLAVSSTWASGSGDQARAAIGRAISIAREQGKASERLRLLVCQHIFQLRMGELRGSLDTAREFCSLAPAANDANWLVVADWLLGSSHHFLGDQTAALPLLDRGFSNSLRPNLQVLGLDYRVRALVTFSRVLWLSGCQNRAIDTANLALAEAEGIRSPLNVCFAYLYTAPLFLWCGEYEAAMSVLQKLTSHPNWHALPSLHATAQAFQGELLVRQGSREAGIELLRCSVRKLRLEKQILFLDRAICALAEALIDGGKNDEALVIVDEAIESVGADEGSVELAELLRLRALGTWASAHGACEQSEARLRTAEAIARRQGAVAWEQRVAMTRRLLVDPGR